MKKKLLTLTMSLAVVVGLSGMLSSPASAAEINVSVGDSIQDAIDGASAGDTINVAAGTFTELLTIDKPLTLNGAQAGVDARARAGAETVIKMPAGSDDLAILVTADDVTISGFTIDGIDNPGSTGIRSFTGAGDNMTVSHNIITNTRNGFHVHAGGVSLDNFTASYNYFDSNNNHPTLGSNGISIGNVTASGVSITNNRFKDTQSSGSSNAIQVAAVAAGDITGVTISGNSSSNDGSFVFLVNTHDVTVSSNTMVGNTGHGVFANGGVNGLTVSGNTFSDSIAHSTLGNIGNGVQLSGVAMEDIVITGNTISGMARAGVRLSDTFAGDSVVVRGNSITGNPIGVLNESDSATVTANENYWGCEAGPGAAGCDTIEGEVVAAEWYVDSGMTATNLDDEDAPGVPNTATAGGLSVAVIALSVAVLVAALAGGAVAARRYVRT